MTPEDQITVCICTFKRPQLLRRLLEKLTGQETSGLFTFSIVVVDNDNDESAKQVVAEFIGSSEIETIYRVEPTSNIALARNKAVGAARANYLAFIDDDEVPSESWLRTLLATCKQYQVAGVLGPVKPRFEGTPPKWLTRAGFYERPAHETGFEMGWQEARTGNVLIRRAVLDNLDPAFRPEFGIGGEDQDFFRRTMEQGHTFIWCNEAPVYESVPPHRWKRSFLLKRALLRGNISLRHPTNRLRNIAKSLVAIPIYGIALPFLFIFRHHLFMRYGVRLFDHLGRLLTLLNLNPIHKRCH